MKSSTKILLAVIGCLALTSVYFGFQLNQQKEISVSLQKQVWLLSAKLASTEKDLSQAKTTLAATTQQMNDLAQQVKDRTQESTLYRKALKDALNVELQKSVEEIRKDPSRHLYRPNEISDQGK